MQGEASSLSVDKQDDSDGDEKVDDDVGTMLKSLGVPVQALGWREAK
jgi:hypothetical protein